MDLHIMDSSNYIYAGNYSNKFISRGVRECDGEYRANEAPIGGVRYLIREASALLNPNTVVMPVFDRKPTIKREMYAECLGYHGYKGTRPAKKSEIVEQQHYAEQVMLDMGFPVQAAEGYEADDVIYSLVKYYKDDFEHVYVHTRDSDLYFLIDPTVEIAMVGKQGNNIDIYSYPTMVKKGEHTGYNTAHLRKLCRGDTADNIPGVGWDFANAIDKIMTEQDYTKCGDLDYCRQVIKRVITENPTLPNGHNILRVFNLLMPLLIDFNELNDIEQDVNVDKLHYYLQDWNKSLDRWNLEDMLAEYIDVYYT